MKQRIHRHKLMFQWITKHHEIIVGFKRVHSGVCSKCGKSIPEGNTMCNECFKQEKTLSNK